MEAAAVEADRHVVAGPRGTDRLDHGHHRKGLSLGGGQLFQGDGEASPAAGALQPFPGGGKEVPHRVQQLGDAPAGLRGAAENGDNPVLQGGAAQDGPHPLQGRRPALQIIPQEGIIHLGQRLQEGASSVPELQFHLVGRGHGGESHGFSLQQIQEARRPPLLVGEGQHEGDGAHGGEEPPHLGEGGVEIRPFPVQLADEGQPGKGIPPGAAPDHFGLGLHTAEGAEDRHGAVHDPQGALHLGGEVDVPRRIQDGVLTAFPGAGDGGAHDGDAPFPLL